MPLVADLSGSLDVVETVGLLFGAKQLVLVKQGVSQFRAFFKEKRGIHLRNVAGAKALVVLFILGCTGRGSSVGKQICLVLLLGLRGCRLLILILLLLDTTVPMQNMINITISPYPMVAITI